MGRRGASQPSCGCGPKFSPFTREAVLFPIARDAMDGVARSGGPGACDRRAGDLRRGGESLLLFGHSQPTSQTRIYVQVWNPLPEPPFPGGQNPVRAPVLSEEQQDQLPILVGIVSYRDGARCGETLYQLFHRASFPARIRAVVLQQNNASDVDCLAAYQKRAGCCCHCDAIRSRVQNFASAAGPITARALLATMIHEERQQLLGAQSAGGSQGDLRGVSGVGGDGFFLQLDAHMYLVEDWDRQIIDMWLRTNNSHAVLSTYAPPASRFGDTPGDPGAPEVPHICRSRWTQEGVPTIEAALFLRGMQRPLRSPFWSAHLSFSTLEALDAVPYDPSFPQVGRVNLLSLPLPQPLSAPLPSGCLCCCLEA